MSEDWSLIEAIGRDNNLGISNPNFAKAMALAVGVMLNEDPRPREQFAADLSEFLGERVSKAMLDAYSSKAREDHGIPVQRFLGIVAESRRWDILDAVMARIGMRIATPLDVELMRVGDAYKALKVLERSLDRFE